MSCVPKRKCLDSSMAWKYVRSLSSYMTRTSLQKGSPHSQLLECSVLVAQGWVPRKCPLFEAVTLPTDMFPSQRQQATSDKSMWGFKAWSVSHRSAEAFVESASPFNLPPARYCTPHPLGILRALPVNFLHLTLHLKSVSRSSLTPANELLPELCYSTLAHMLN